jgi:hypothetical protein
MNLRRRIIAVLGFVVMVATISFSSRVEDFFSADEIRTMRLAEQYNSEYQRVSFTIRQIFSNKKALVSNDGGDFILYGDFSNMVDGRTFSVLVKMGKPEQYTTVIGSTRTLATYHAIGQKELDIIQSSKPLLSRKKLVDEELRREKGSSFFKEQRDVIVKTVEVMNAFLQENKPDYDGQYYSELHEIETKRKALEEVIIRQEYYGEAITSATLTELSASLNLLRMKIAREEKDKEIQESLLAKEREERLRQETLEKEALAMKKERELQERIEQNKKDEVLFDEWLVKTSILYFTLNIEKDVLGNDKARWDYRDAEERMEFVYTFNNNSDWDIETKNRQRSSLAACRS